MLLEIKNLKVVPTNGISKNKINEDEKGEVKEHDEEILKGINLKIKKGEVHALLGPNGSGKSVLLQSVSGNPKYKITEGEILFNKKKINNLTPEKRTKEGIALAWQNTPNLRGVNFSTILKNINKKDKKNDGFFDEKVIQKDLGSNLSGGEKKIGEIEQMKALNPKLLMLDEINSGLDIKKVKEIVEIIKKEFIEKGISVLLVTHSGEILNFLKPDSTSVLVSGKIICTQYDHKKILKTIKQYGYEKCQKHALSSHK